MCFVLEYRCSFLRSLFPNAVVTVSSTATLVSSGVAVFAACELFKMCSLSVLLEGYCSLMASTLFVV